MEAKDIKQLPVVNRGGDFPRERKRKIVAVLFYDSILQCLRFLLILVYDHAIMLYYFTLALHYGF